MSLSRRLLIASRGAGGFHGPRAVILTGPYTSDRVPGTPVIAQVHCHTTQSDGTRSPEQIVADYLAAGYGALAITDHNKHTLQPPGMATPLPGDEYTNATHVIGINAPTYNGSGDAQTCVNGIIADGGEAHVAHPRWQAGMTYSALLALTGHVGIEVYNMHCATGAGSSSPTTGFAVELWDQLLTGGPLTAAIAVDDLHMLSAWKAHDVGRLRMFTTSGGVGGFMEALSTRNFVADVSNHGVVPGYPERDASGISVSASGATRMEAYGLGGALLASAAGETLAWNWQGDERYVRFEAVGDYAEPFDTAIDRWAAAEGTWAWTGGQLVVTADANAQRYILRRHRRGDFESQVDVTLSNLGTEQAGLMYNVLHSGLWYLVRIGQSGSGSFNNRLTVGLTTNSPFASVPYTAEKGVPLRMKISYTAATGRIRAKVWKRDAEPEPDWMIDATNTNHREGGFGLRANRSVAFDNFYANGFRTYYQPIGVELA